MGDNEIKRQSQVIEDLESEIGTVIEDGPAPSRFTPPTVRIERHGRHSKLFIGDEEILWPVDRDGGVQVTRIGQRNLVTLTFMAAEVNLDAKTPTSMGG